MTFGARAKKEEKEKEMTIQEAVLEIGKSVGTLTKDIAELKKKSQEQPKPTEPVAQPVAQPQPQVKKNLPKFVVYDEPIKHQRHILDNSDPENPVVYDIETALVKILNEVMELKKALA